MGAAPTGGAEPYDFGPVFEQQAAAIPPATRPTSVGTDYSSPFVPTPVLARGSGVFSRAYGIGTGAPQDDPLETFKPQHTKLEHTIRKVVRRRPVDPNRLRRKGLGAYHSAFPENEGGGEAVGEAY